MKRFIAGFIYLFYYLFYRPLFYLLLVLSVLILGPLALFLTLFDRTGNTVHYIGKFWSRLNVALAGVRVNVRGLPCIERGRSYVVMSNHQSYFDVWALIGWLPLQLRWVMKKELKKTPIFGLVCGRMGHIYIDRGDIAKAKKSLEAAGGKLRAGASVVFFPEGTRSPDGKLLPFKKGGFVVAMEAGVPILPVTVNGGGRVLPRGSLKLMPGRIEVVVHDPVETAGRGPAVKEDLVEEIRKKIEDALVLR